MTLEALMQMYSEESGWEPQQCKLKRQPVALQQKTIDKYISTLQKYGTLSRKQLIRLSTLSIGSVTKITKVMVSDGLVTVKSERKSRYFEKWISLV